MAINLIPQEEPTNKIDLNRTSNVSVQDPEVLEARAQRADYGLGSSSYGIDSVRSDFWLGFEDRLRQQASVQTAIEERKARQGQISQIVQTAALEDRPLDDLESQLVMDLTSPGTVPEPGTVLENLYARRFVNDAMLNSEEDVLGTEPEQLRQMQAAASSWMTKQQIAHRVAEEMQSRFDEANIFQKGFDFAKSLVPFYDWVNLRDQVQTPNSPFFLGENIEAQISRVYFLSDEEFEREIRQAVDGAAQGSVWNGLMLAQAFITYSSYDAAFDNVFTGLDVLDVATLGATGAVGAAASSARLGNRLKSGIRAEANITSNPASRMVAQGDVAGAAENLAQTRLDEVLPTARVESEATPTSAPRAQNPDAQFRGGFAINDVSNYMRGADSLAHVRSNRLLDNISANRALLMSTMTDLTNMSRINEVAFTRGTEIAERQFRSIYRNLEDTIIDVRPVRGSEEAFGGVDRIDVMIGTKDGLAFDNPTQASTHASKVYRLANGSYDIVEDSGNYLIKMFRTVDETAEELGPLRIGTDNTAPETFANTWIGFLRSPDDVLSSASNQMRKTATYGANAVLQRLAEASRSLGRLSGNETTRLKEIIDGGKLEFREVMDTDGQVKRVRGKFYRDVGELEQAYMSRFKTTPSEQEIEGYFTFREIMDFDHTMRNTAVYRDKARLGIEQKSFAFKQKDASGRNKTVSTDFFEGRDLEALPSMSGDPFTILWVNNKSGKVDFGLSSRLFGSQRADIQKLVDSGDYQIIQVTDDTNLRGVTNTYGENIDYAIVPNQKTKPLSFNQVPYNEGGHWNYNPNGVFLKQPRTRKTGMGRRIFDGDITAHYFASGAQGREFAEAYNTARGMLKEVRAGQRSMSDLDTFVNANLPYRGSKGFDALFRNKGNADAPFDIDAPFVLTQSGQRSSDIVKLEDLFDEPVVDRGRSQHSVMSRVNTEYAQERGELLTTVDQAGTEANPVYALSGAPMVDPFEALARDASRLARNRYYDDYKRAEIENWALQFGDTIDAPAAAVRADPVRYLREPIYKSDYQDAAKLAAAKNTRRAILSLLGEDTVDMKAMKWTKQKIVDSVFKAHGKKGLRLIEPYLWNTTTDPATMMRAATFHAKLGLFNPVQLPLQGAAVLHVAAVDGNPIRAAQGVFSYWGMRMRKLAEGTGQEKMFSQNTAKALGVSETDLDEMYSAWRRTGMDIIEGEHARLDDYLNPKMFERQAGIGGVTAAAGKALDAGKVFFNEGNQLHRGTAFSVAYLRWRQTNPKSRMTDAVLRGIVERADLYYINMSRASNSTWQRGLMGIPTQFFAYHARLAEQMLGTRLTMAEKLRVFGAYSLMWGVPIGAGTAAGIFWPVNDAIRGAAIENGYDPEQASVVSKFLMEGAASMVVEMAVGENFDIGARMGPGGLSWMRDLIDTAKGGDTSLFDVLGASPNFVTSVANVADPFTRHVVSVFSPESELYPLTQADFVDAFREVTSFSNTVKAYQVFTTGEWLTKRDGLVGNVDSGDFATAALTALGLTPQEISDAYLRLDSNTAVANAKNQISQQAMLNFERGLKAAINGDEELTDTFFRRSHTLMQSGGFTPVEAAAVFRRSIVENESMLDEVNQEFMFNDPENRRDWYFNTRQNQEIQE